MALSKQVNGGNTTITWTQTATTQKITDILSDAAKYLYGVGLTAGVELAEGETVNDLTNAEIATIIDSYLVKVLRDAAKTYHINLSAETARLAAVVETETKYL